MWVARQMGHSTMKMLLENYSCWIDLADKQREKSKIEQLFDGKCANSVPKNTEMKISIGYLSDILVEAGESNPRPEVLYRAFYILSRVYLKSRSYHADRQAF